MKKFEVSITMVVGMAEDVHYHTCTLEGRDEFDVFQHIKDCNWFHYEREIISIEQGVQNVKRYQEFIQVRNISDISILEIHK